MPGPPRFGGQPVTNIRNLHSPHWRGWLGKNRRCVVPATSFCEYAGNKPRKTPTWFALSEDRPLFAFAGLWTPRRGVRGPKSAPVESNHELFGFLTTEANAVVAPVHPKAMPVILTSPTEVDRWFEAETADARYKDHCRTTPSGSLRRAKRRMRRLRADRGIIPRNRSGVVRRRPTHAKGAYCPDRDRRRNKGCLPGQVNSGLPPGGRK
jgi:putative SOS response-associated peptidase YedK